MLDPRRLVHELQVHQVELELQNAELQQAQDRMEVLVNKYTDLYDFAPVGYFSLDAQGRIREVNLTGATLLGVERSQLLDRAFGRQVAATSRAVFEAFWERVFTGAAGRVCEVALRRAGGESFWASLHGGSVVAGDGRGDWCRVAVSDITSLKQAEEAQRRMEELAAANRELRREISRRQAVEAALKSSEQHQSRLLEQSHQMQEQLRSLSHCILEAQEEERKRISRELHDEITQTLVGINVHLETLARESGVHPRGLRKRIARTQRLVEKSVRIVHQFARELRPPALDDLGLIATLHSLLKDFSKRTGIRVQFTTFAEVEQMDSARRTVLYRVVHSALANIAQHARATGARVSLRRIADAVQLEVSDNGQSFEVARVLQAKRNQRLGLLGMRERVEMVGGEFSVVSTSGQGTTVRAQIPFRSVAARRLGSGAGQWKADSERS